jgi:hypothetical protein
MANAKVVNGPMQVIPVQNVLRRNLTVTSTAKDFIESPVLNVDTTHVYWTLAGADMRMSIDGSAPTTSNGHIIKDGNSGIWSRKWAESTKVIAISGAGVFTISELNYI